MINIAALTKRMSRLKYFRSLSLTDITGIVASGSIKTMKAGSVIVMEESPCAGLFVLLSGRVHLFRLGPNGQEVLIDTLDSITMFNEVSILDGGPNPFTVIAAQDCIIWNADYQTLQGLADRYPQVALGFLPVLAARTRVLIAMVADVCFRSVRGRTAKLILDLSDHGEWPISRQEHSIHMLAAQISTAPEAVSRALSFFRNEGYISTSRSTIKVCDAKGLAEFAQIEGMPCPRPPDQPSRMSWYC
ncbi:MAG: Crp/Fnr family transcriptional regulator [Anaerolineae bacterium]|nr:Crp/Fnr family transcriptional regulator [Anaerolineae bacterium]MEB2288571.1 Crp/Fnr family transcriptional regulator [Anaerolineae bacterium]